MKGHGTNLNIEQHVAQTITGMSASMTCRPSGISKCLTCNSSHMVFGNRVKSPLKQAAISAISNWTIYKQ